MEDSDKDGSQIGDVNDKNARSVLNGLVKGNKEKTTQDPLSNDINIADDQSRPTFGKDTIEEFLNDKKRSIAASIPSKKGSIE